MAAERKRWGAGGSLWGRADRSTLLRGGRAGLRMLIADAGGVREVLWAI